MNLGFFLSQLNVQENMNRSIDLSQIVLVNPQTLLKYPKQIQNIYHIIFNNKDQELFLKDHLPFELKITSMPICNKILTSFQQVIRCYDCSNHEASVYCQNCFENGNHHGHRFAKFKSGGGNCDCGCIDAIKQIGFCKQHPGIAHLVYIDKIELQQFMKYFLILFQWLFILSKKSMKKQTDHFGFLIGQYLKTINQTSLYYNTLTYKLFLLKIQGQSILTRILQLGQFHKCSHIMLETFFTMFSLQQFKFELAIEFVKAYNKIDNFDRTCFKDIFIQIFANKNLILNMINKNNLYLNPTQRKYQLSPFLGNLLFLTSIPKQASQQYFKYSLSKSIIKLPMIDQIEKQCQKGPYHIAEIMGENLEEQNLFYNVMTKIIKVIQKTDTIDQIILQYYQLIVSQNLSYQKNKVILPYHRILASAIYVKFGCNLKNLSIKFLLKILDITQKQLLQFLQKTLYLLFRCLKQFATSFIQTTYLENYLPLYIRSGKIIFTYDLLMMKICIIFLQQFKQNTIVTSLLTKICIEPLVQSQKQQQQEQKQNNTIKILNQMIDLLIQVCVSNREEVIVRNELQYQMEDPQFMQMMHQYRYSIYSALKQFTTEDQEQISRYFCCKSEDLSKYLIFDKAKKLYMVRENNVQPINFIYYPSLNKIGGIFNQEKNNQLQSKIHLNSGQNCLRESIFCQKFIEVFLNQNTDDSNAKSLKILLEKLSTLFDNKNILINQRLQRIQLKKQGQDHKDEERRKQLFKKKKLKRMQQMKKKQDKFQNQLMAIENQETEIHSEENCIICHQENKDYPLCYLGNFKLSNMVNCFVQYSGQSWRFDSCFHTIHPHCFTKLSDNHENITCPLCMTKVNLMLPMNIEQNNQDLLNKVLERIQIISASWDERLLQDKINKTLLFSLLMSIVQYISVKLMEKVIQLHQKEIKLIKIIFQLAYFQFKKKSQIKIEEQQIAIYEYINNMKRKKQNKSQYNFAKLTKAIMITLFSYLKSKTTFYNKETFIYEYKHFLEETQVHKIWNIIQQILFIQFKIQKEVQIIPKKQDIIIPKKQDIIIPKKQDIIIPKKGLFPSLDQMFRIYSPPKSALQLIKVRDSSQYGCKSGHKVCICIYCEKNFCHNCGGVNRHGLQQHCGQTLLFSVLTGSLIYLWKGPTFEFPPLYYNNMGGKWLPYMEPKGFTFDLQMYEEINQHFINNRLINHIIQNYADMLHQNLLAAHII